MDKERILSSKELIALKKGFGEQVKKYRLQANLSQEDLGFECGLHRTYIGSIERGETNLSLENIAILAITLRCKVSALFPCLNSIRRKNKSN